MYYLLLLRIVTSTDPLYTWVKEENMEGLIPVSRGGHSTTQIGRLLYVFGGCDLYMQCFNDLHTYNTDTKI